MSFISSTHHKVCDFTKDSKAFQDNVLLRIISKGKESRLDSSKCVSVPEISTGEVTTKISALMPAIQAMIHDARQQIARGLIIEGATEISTDVVNLDAAINWLVDDSSGRVTTQVMQEWFTENYAEVAMEFVCKQIKFDTGNLTPEQEKLILQKTNVIRDVFAGFASGKYKPSLPVCKMIIGFGAFCADQVDSRLSAILKKTETIRDEQIKMLEMDFNDVLEAITPIKKSV